MADTVMTEEVTISPDDRVHHLKSTLGGYARRGNDAAAEQTRRELAVARVEARIAAAVESAPPLPEESRRRIRQLIAPLLGEVPTGER